jgi:hypothetical protein
VAHEKTKLFAFVLKKALLSDAFPASTDNSVSRSRLKKALLSDALPA